MNLQKIQKMKKAGYILKLIAVPLPDYSNLKKYSRDKGVKQMLAPYQTINPCRLKKPVVD